MTTLEQINYRTLLKRSFRRSNAKSASNKFKAQKRLTPKQVKKHKLKVLKKKRQIDRLFDRTVQQAKFQEISDLRLICYFCGICHDDMRIGSCQCYDSNDYDDDSDYFAANYDSDDSDDEHAYGYYLQQHLRQSKDDEHAYRYYLQQHLRSSKTVDHYDSDDSDETSVNTYYDPFDWRN